MCVCSAHMYKMSSLSTVSTILCTVTLHLMCCKLDQLSVLTLWEAGGGGVRVQPLVQHTHIEEGTAPSTQRGGCSTHSHT